jgi:hypothetical protein
MKDKVQAWVTRGPDAGRFLALPPEDLKRAIAQGWAQDPQGKAAQDLEPAQISNHTDYSRWSQGLAPLGKGEEDDGAGYKAPGLAGVANSTAPRSRPKGSKAKPKAETPVEGEGEGEGDGGEGDDDDDGDDGEEADDATDDEEDKGAGTAAGQQYETTAMRARAPRQASRKR